MERIKEIFDKYTKKTGMKTRLEAALDYYINNLNDKGYSYSDLADRWGWSKSAAYKFISSMDEAPKHKPRQTPVKEKPKKSTVKMTKSTKLSDLKHPVEGMDKKYFYIAKGFHTLFLKYHGTNKTLTSALADKWVDETRKIIEIDKVRIEQMVAIKMYWDEVAEGVAGLDSFWLDTISSMAAFRKKNKDDEFYYDLIVRPVKKWTDTGQNTAKVHNKVKEFKKYVGIT